MILVRKNVAKPSVPLAIWDREPGMREFGLELWRSPTRIQESRRRRRMPRRKSILHLEKIKSKNMVPIKRKPTAPGEILKEEFLKPLGLTQKELAEHIGCDIKVINRIVNGRSSVSALMAFRLASAFHTSPDFWLNAQQTVDLYKARKRLRHLPGSTPRRWSQLAWTA